MLLVIPWQVLALSCSFVCVGFLFTAAYCCSLPVQVIDIDYVNEAMKRMEKGDVKFRFVIDINKSLVM